MRTTGTITYHCPQRQTRPQAVPPKALHPGEFLQQQNKLSFASRRQAQALSRCSTLKLECGPMPNVMAALPNTGGALCSTPLSLADAVPTIECRAV